MSSLFPPPGNFSLLNTILDATIWLIILLLSYYPSKKLISIAEKQSLTTTTKNKKPRPLDIQIAFLSAIHALTSSIIATYIVLRPDGTLLSDRMYGTSPTSQYLFRISTSYFFFDVCLILTDLQGMGGFPFLIHGTLCLICYCLVQYPFLQYDSCLILLYETSTPFLNARIVLRMLSMNDSIVGKVNEACFALSFVLVRLVLGIPMSIGCIRMLIRDGLLDEKGYERLHSVPVLMFVICSNVVLSCLNVVWGRKILRIGLRSIRETFSEKGKEEKMS